ncbi:hypothetical protein HGRIS_001188 [Hohenbuehelia grisea]|uniref:Uncharacterized protein n=1 Tax=Hohenbuehelia grisea TaxID=104357 RepID=A0ABR3JNR1_9AGAR
MAIVVHNLARPFTTIHNLARPFAFCCPLSSDHLPFALCPLSSTPLYNSEPSMRILYNSVFLYDDLQSSARRLCPSHWLFRIIRHGQLLSVYPGQDLCLSSCRPFVITSRR